LGGGLGLVLPPTAYLVLGSGRPGDVAPASCTINAIRSTGGALGIAALLAVVMSNGGYGSASAFTDGLVRALWVASAVAAVGTLGSMLIPGRKRGVHEVAATVVREPAGYPVLPPEESVAVAETHEPTDPDPAHVPTVETFPCPVCLGHGEFTFTPPRDPHTDTCPRCYGHGTVLTGSHVPAHLVRDCPDCQGLGYVETRMLHEDLRIRREVPAGSPPPLEEHVPDELHES